MSDSLTAGRIGLIEQWLSQTSGENGPWKVAQDPDDPRLFTCLVPFLTFDFQDAGHTVAPMGRGYPEKLMLTIDKPIKCITITGTVGAHDVCRAQG